VAAVEFALILPVLALILFGVLEFGRVWSQYQLFQGAAREGARCAAVASTSDCVVQDEIDQAAAPFDPEGTADIVVLGGGGNAEGCTDDDRGKDVQVSWQQTLELNIPFWDSAELHPIIKAVFRCE
jgi:Flp pilus assembly protein TadG